MSGDSADTVHPRIASALSRGEELASTDAHEHVPIYEEVHETLQQVLAEAGAGASPDVAPADSADEHPDESPEP